MHVSESTVDCMCSNSSSMDKGCSLRDGSMKLRKTMNNELHMVRDKVLRLYSMTFWLYSLLNPRKSFNVLAVYYLPWTVKYTVCCSSSPRYCLSSFGNVLGRQTPFLATCLILLALNLYRLLVISTIFQRVHSGWDSTTCLNDTVCISRTFANHDHSDMSCRGSSIPSSVWSAYACARIWQGGRRFAWETICDLLRQAHDTHDIIVCVQCLWSARLILIK